MKKGAGKPKQRARNVIATISGPTAVQINLPRAQGLDEYPILVEDMAKTVLPPVADALVVLKKAGVKPFTVRVRWNTIAGSRVVTPNEIQTAAQTLASEFIRGLVENSNGRLQNRDFVINAQGAIVVNDAAIGLSFSIIIP